MSPAIDPRTIVLLLSVGNILAAGLLIAYRAHQTIPTRYVLARLAQGAGWALFWQMGPEVDWLHYFGGNALVNIGMAMEAVAVLERVYGIPAATAARAMAMSPPRQPKPTAPVGEMAMGSSAR